MSNHPEMKKSVAKLLKEQNNKCEWCLLPFQEGDKLETDHITPAFTGGSKKLDNCQLLHKHCHDIKTKSNLKVIKLYKAQKEWVNDIPTLVKGTHKEPSNRGAQ